MATENEAKKIDIDAKVKEVKAIQTILDRLADSRRTGESAKVKGYRAVLKTTDDESVKAVIQAALDAELAKKADSAGPEEAIADMEKLGYSFSDIVYYGISNLKAKAVGYDKEIRAEINEAIKAE
jgi:rubrerythrin